MNKQLDRYLLEFKRKHNIMVPISHVEDFARLCRMRKILYKYGRVILNGFGNPEYRILYLRKI